MKILIGLGNPGKEYLSNRHNVGFMFAEYFLKKNHHKNPLSLDKKAHAVLTELLINEEKWIVAEPQTYMNASGETVTRLANFYKVVPSNIIVAHDDLDIPLGKFKIQMGNGPKLHGGLSSIEQLLGTGSFWRVRIGVENRNPENRISGEAYVLQNFTEEESSLLITTFEKIYTQLSVQKLM